MNDPETECIVMIGEIGGQQKQMLPGLKPDGNRKPVGSSQELLLQLTYNGAWCKVDLMIPLKLKQIMRECGITLWISS
jgi:succinyl-CoA synthetase alpha subunit